MKSPAADPTRKETAARDIRKRNATRMTVSTFGALAGLAGIEHGIGEVLQGSVAPGGVMILSWPETGLFRILAGEPAMTIFPNLLATGILAILLSMTFLVWVTKFVQRRNGGLILLLLSALMLLAGGGFGPTILGTIVGVAAIRIGVPLRWWCIHLSGASLRSQDGPVALVVSRWHNRLALAIVWHDPPRSILRCGRP
jgi:hypothetical protein